MLSLVMVVGRLVSIVVCAAVVVAATALWTTSAPSAAAASTVVKVAATPDGDGLMLLWSDGSVTGYGSAPSAAAPTGLASGERFTTIVPTAGGMLRFTSRGRAFASGTAVHRGDLAAVALNGPIVDVAATVSGAGYWMLGSDGGVFSFGDATFAGSTGALRLNRPAIGLVGDADGDGYRFVASDGGVFTFRAPFRGSLGAVRLNQPVVGMIPFGDGYLMVAADGGVFTFSGRSFLGSIGDAPELTRAAKVVGIAAPLSGDWYVVARADGALYPFGRSLPAWLLDVAASRSVPPSTIGTPGARVTVPSDGALASTSSPRTVVGDGTAASCTSAAVVAAVARGGVVTFSCGPDPVVITMRQTAKVVNTTGPEIVIDGGGKVTLSGGGARRILYMNTCDPAQVWTTSHCQDQDHPRLTIQRIGFVDGDATGETIEGGGGGAVFVRGGRVRVIDSWFQRNRCDPSGPDVGGGALRVLSQSQGLPVWIVGSTFGGGPGDGNRCSNGGALSSIGVSWQVVNSWFANNQATGWGANPQRAGTPGGGNGGAIALDGNRYSLRLAGTIIEDGVAPEGGGSVFFVSNDRTGTLTVEDSILRRNRSERFETPGYPGVFFLGAGTPSVVRSSLG